MVRTLDIFNIARNLRTYNFVKKLENLKYGAGSKSRPLEHRCERRRMFHVLFISKKRIVAHDITNPDYERGADISNSG